MYAQIVSSNSNDKNSMGNLTRLKVGANSRVKFWAFELPPVSVLGWVSESCVLCMVCVCFVCYFSLVIVLLLCCGGKSSEFWSSGSGQDAELSGSFSFVSLFSFSFCFFFEFFFFKLNFGMIIWFMVKKKKNNNNNKKTKQNNHDIDIIGVFMQLGLLHQKSLKIRNKMR